MKKFLLLLTAAAFFACNSEDNNAKVQGAADKNDSSKNDVTYPYEILYSAKFEIGDVEKSKMILELWKDFDAGDISKHKDYFADTVLMQFSDGTSMHNSRDSIVAATNAYRGMYSSVVSRVDAILPARSTDKNEDWVSVWGMETHTMNGKTDSVHLHEAWRFNSQGKVDLMMQYSRAATAPKR